MRARKRLSQQFALALPLWALVFGSFGIASAQSTWQKMKLQFLEQACRGGDQNSCRQLTQLKQKLGQQPQQRQQQQGQQQGQQPGQQPGQPTPPMQGHGHREAERGGDESGPVHPPSGTKVEETVLAPLAPQARFSISPHGVHVATLESSGSRAVIYYDGVAGPKFDEVIGGQIGASDSQVAFSPDGRRFAYCGRSGDEMVVMVDGKEFLRTKESNMGRFDETSCKLGFTSNSKHVFLYSSARRSTSRGDGRIRFIFDGKDVPGTTAKPTGGNEDIRDIFFSPDGDHFALVVSDLADETKWGLVVDGKMAPYRGSPVSWSPDSQHLYSVISHSGASGYMEAMLDGKPFIRADQLTLHVAPACNLWVAVVDAGIHNPSPTQFLVVNGKKIPGSEIVHQNGAFIDQVAFSPDGKHFAARYTTTQNRQYLVVDGKRAQEYQKIDNVVFTTEPTKVTYTAFSNGKPYAIIGDQESDACSPALQNYANDSHGGLVIAPIGGRAGGICSLNGGEAPTLYLDGKMVRLPEGVRGASDLRFSSDGQHYVYRAGFQGGGMRLVVDNVVQMNSNLGTPSTARYQNVFSPDSKHIASDSASPTDTGVFSSGLFLDGKYIPVQANSGMHILEFTSDSKHIAWAQGVPSRNAMRIYIDGKAVAEADTAIAYTTREAWWDMQPDGSLAVLAQDENNLKRITITPSAETSLATLGGGGALVARGDQ